MIHQKIKAYLNDVLKGPLKGKMTEKNFKSQIRLRFEKEFSKAMDQFCTHEKICSELKYYCE